MFFIETPVINSLLVWQGSPDVAGDALPVFHQQFLVLWSSRLWCMDVTCSCRCWMLLGLLQLDDRVPKTPCSREAPLGDLLRTNLSLSYFTPLARSIPNHHLFQPCHTIPPATSPSFPSLQADLFSRGLRHMANRQRVALPTLQHLALQLPMP